MASVVERLEECRSELRLLTMATEHSRRAPEIEMEAINDELEALHPLLKALEREPIGEAMAAVDLYSECARLYYALCYHVSRIIRREGGEGEGSSEPTVSPTR